MALPQDRSAQVALISVAFTALFAVAFGIVLNQIDSFDVRNIIGVLMLAVLLAAALCALGVSAGRYMRSTAGASAVVSSRRGTRQWLAGTTIAMASLGLFGLAIVVIFKTRVADERMQVFTTLVPVFASWVGTVLAFYFGRESFIAANEQVSKLISGQNLVPGLAAVAVRSAMTPVAKIALIATDQEPDSITVTEMENKLGDHSRLPITWANRSPRYLIHKSVIDSFNGSGPATNLHDLISQSGRSFEVGSGFAVVAATGTLQDVADALKQEGIEDALVTEDGLTDQPLIGWVTDKKLDKYRTGPI